MSDPVIVVDGVSKKYGKRLRTNLRYGVQDILAEFRPNSTTSTTLRQDEFWALRDVSFTVEPGQAVGIIGPNGAGKSTLLRLVSGLIKPDTGRIMINGIVRPLLELGAGFDPVLTGRENVYVNAAMLGIGRNQVDATLDAIIDFAEIEEFIDTPVQNYSNGMRLRLGFATATQFKPDIMLIDEVLSVGDMAFRRKCIQHMQGYLNAGGALVLVSHNLHEVQAICNHGLLLDHGQVVFEGSGTATVRTYFERYLDGINAKAANAESDDEDATMVNVAADQLDADNPVSITKIEAVPQQGDEIIINSAVDIVVHYRALQAVPNIFWGFMVWTADGSLCILGDMTSGDTGAGALKAGSGTLRCTIPRLPLESGRYTLRVAIVDAVTKVSYAMVGWDGAAASFAVKSEATEDENMIRTGGLLVRTDVVWHTEEQA